MISSDTIVAISSATGAGARMIVRLSGPAALGLARDLTDAAIDHAVATRTTIRFAGLPVPAWVYAFHAPRSSTGEDVVELHVPGNPLLASMLMTDLLARGARSAEPGEFTARAYFNGKLDLSAAEGVAAAIGARSAAQLRAARQLLAGELANRVRPMLDALAETLALLEVGIDFVDEDVTFLSPAEVADRIASVVASIDALRRESARIEPLAHEPTVVLVGRPNAGKSTLLNALARTERAVVSDVAGTTRDVVSHAVALRRGTVRVLDVAGVESADATDDVRAAIARDMQARTRRATESADVVVHVHAADDPRPPLVLDRSADVFVVTKSDVVAPNRPAGALALSAVTGEGLDDFRRTLDAVCFGATERRGLALNVRHLRHLADATDALTRATAANRDDAGPEVVAMELRHALDDLGEIVGSVSPDELLGRVFSRFCIGK